VAFLLGFETNRGYCRFLCPARAFFLPLFLAWVGSSVIIFFGALFFSELSHRGDHVELNRGFEVFP